MLNKPFEERLNMFNKEFAGLQSKFGLKIGAEPFVQAKVVASDQVKVEVKEPVAESVSQTPEGEEAKV